MVEVADISILKNVGATWIPRHEGVEGDGPSLIFFGEYKYNAHYLFLGSGPLELRQIFVCALLLSIGLSTDHESCRILFSWKNCPLLLK